MSWGFRIPIGSFPGRQRDRALSGAINRPETPAGEYNGTVGMPTSRMDCDQRAWLVITASLAVIYLLLRPDFILKDGDTYWQVATGQWIITHAALPTTDPFSYTMAGEPWVLFRQWLSQIALALVFNAAGWGELVALSPLGLPRWRS